MFGTYDTRPSPQPRIVALPPRPAFCRQASGHKSHTRYLTFKTQERFQLLNITDDVQTAVQESQVREGLCLVNAMHITASVFINDDEPGLHADYRKWLEGWLRLMPRRSATRTTARAKTTPTPT